MPRSVWQGVISFGMVSIPVMLYGATKGQDVSFHLLHKECRSRLKQVRWCPVHEREVEGDEIARGFEYAKDQYVVVSEEDFEKLPLPTKDSIQLLAFVQREEIDPIYYDRSYYLEPAKGGGKPFALLLRALAEKGLTAIGKIAFRNKEHLCALRSMDGVLVLETLFYADEVTVEKRTKAPQVEVSEGEMAMAATLIDLLSKPFEPAGYRDDYREALMQVIEAKVQGHEVVEAPPAPTPVVIDLMSALRASVEAAKKSNGKVSRGPARRTAAKLKAS